MSSVVTAPLAVAAAAGAAIVFVEIVHWIVKRIGRRYPLAAALARTMHRPFLATVTLTTVQQAVRIWAGDFHGRSGVVHALVLLCIAAAAWLVGATLLVLEDMALARWRTDVPDNLKSRRIKTQVVMLRRVTVAAIVVLTIGVMLMTFPDIRALGASVLASAGVISVVAALAAQSTLGNVFAGIQLAFSDAIRVDDVVVVEQEWGRIEEITLTYVVLQIWDDRRLILPTSYFTTKPFQNWTRTSSAVLGTAEIDVDWATPIEPVRAELRRVCEESDLWNGKVCVLQVTEAVDGRIRLRALVSANDAAALWDLRCLVRERLVGWIWQHQRAAVPRMRAEVEQAAPVPVQPVRRHRPDTVADADADSDAARVFSGGLDGEARGVVFGGPVPVASESKD
ncbi:mechanosensitive ion channel family protein [Actinoplanes xinjiangensis]|uniref:Small-conductance mechanosensitive channel n=1 Tax=Actinoplanes xinjiangensis TaxID=512350 RepID=A0A316FUA0_9ACTN|nr:mechanosensitive ion channel domain-containing protein [Actinoplanes xinjiangensis]PWK51180.1 small-conductance mechanosensitive channel [Actinoplanes xinjiangensis]GIF39837.1 mechanosensitive ion channel protein MscS [Actinoplanes xinjiangensis]